MNKLFSGDSACKKVSQLTAKKLIPIYVFWELTRNCNLSCVHCYIKKEKRREASFSEISLAMDRLKDMGSLIINFSGGEVFLRNDFFKIANFARENGFAIKIFTNGTKINHTIVRKLKKLEPLYVEISIYSNLPEIHDRVTGVKGSWSKSMAAIKGLIQEGLRVRLKCSLIKQNYETFKETKYFFERLGVPYQFNPVLMPIFDKDKEVSLNKRQRAFIARNIINDLTGGLTKAEKLRMTMCSAGINSLTINAYGDLLPCIAFPVGFGTILNDDIENAWRNDRFLQELRGIKNKDLKYCSICSRIEFCSRCPGIALSKSKDYRQPYSEACELASLKSHSRS